MTGIFKKFKNLGISGKHYMHLNIKLIEYNVRDIILKKFKQNVPFF